MWYITNVASKWHMIAAAVTARVMDITLVHYEIASQWPA